MQKLVFRNANGTELDLTSDPYGITEWEGFSADELNIQSQQVPFQDGSVFLDALLGERELAVTVAMNDGNNLEKRYRLRREMISALNPKLGEGVLIYTNDFLSKQIHVIPQLPVFENHNSNDSGTPKVSCVFNACNPYWEDLEETSVVFSANEQPVIENEGDVDCKLNINFLSQTGMTNPAIVKINDNRKIECRGSFTNNININTNDGKKTVTGIINKAVTVRDKGTPTGLYYVPEKRKYYKFGKSVYFTSEDLEHWSFNVFAMDWKNLVAFAYGENKYILIGGSNYHLSSYYSTDGDNWEETYGLGLPSYFNCKDAIYSTKDHCFVITGEGEIYTSDGESTVVERPTGVSATFNSIACNDSIYVLVGDNGVIVTSNDLTTWSSRTSGTNKKLNKVKWIPEKNLFCAVGDDGVLLTSADGISWTSISTSLTTDIFDLSYNASLGELIMVGEGGTITEYNFYYFKYTENFMNASLLYILTVEDKIVIASSVNNIFYGYSVDGLIGNKDKNDGEIEDCAFSKKDKFYLFVGNSSTEGRKVTIKSYDLENFQILDTDVYFKYIVYNEEEEKFYAGNQTGIYTGTNGEDWELSLSGNAGKLYYLNGKVIAINGTSLTYYNGEWHSVTLQLSAGDICYAEDKGIYMLASGGYSENLETWTEPAQAKGIYCVYNKLEKQFYIFKDDMNTFYGSYDCENWNSYPKTVIFGSPIRAIYSEDMQSIVVLNYDGEALFLTSPINQGVIRLTSLVHEGYGSTTVRNMVYNSYDKEILVLGERGVISTYTKSLQGSEVNLINTLTSESDMNLELSVGQNQFRLSKTGGDFNCILTYRQKYIGV